MNRRYVFVLDAHHRPGTWKPLVNNFDEKRVVGATITCPECGESGSLDDHKIESNGIVSPSVQCASEGCTFHVEAVLDGWNGSHYHLH